MSVKFLNENYRATYSITSDILSPLPPFPRIMMLELSNACNHSCSFCFNKNSTRRRGSINGNLLESVLRDAYQLGTRKVGFYSTGEPLIYKNIEKYIQLAKRIGYDYIYITTNGALAFPDKIERLLLAGIDSIKFSINAGTRETYRLIHGKDDFDRVLENLMYLRRYRDCNNVKLMIGAGFALTNTNRHEKRMAEDIVGKIVDDIVFYEEINHGGYMNRSDIPRLVESTPCSMVFNRFHVSYEGYFTLCCVDYQNYLAVSDLNKVSLYDAWASEIAVDMRKKHLSSTIEGTLCQRCITGDNSIVMPLVDQYATPFDF